ncbi:DUF2135 domain-containing protein [Allomuricauda sp. d1]|uniref:DUF2135 domain-containing protein n=1 Tax=Allomuricauda sp. d1 TaxID=3136725 RepID=UPI0031D9DA2D
MRTVLFTLIIFLVAFTSINAQRTVTGKVSDGKNPIEDVNISIVNKGESTVTNDDGSYKITADIGDVVFYSTEGMEPIQIRVEDVTRILNVEMFPRVEKLDNVTVTSSRNNSQKELELLYATNPNIIKTAFGYLDSDKVSYSARILQDRQILPGEFDLANVLRNRFAGVRVSNGIGFGVRTPQALSSGFGGSAGTGGRAVLLRSGWPALFDIDGQLFTDFPDFIDVQNIQRLAVIPSAIGTVRYGSLGRGGVIVINTKTGVPELRDENGLPLDIARKKDNFYAGTALSEEMVQKNAPIYLKELQSATSFEKAVVLYENFAEKYSSSPYFFLDVYRHFYSRWNDEDFADNIIENNFGQFSDNPVLLKALAYSYDAQERFVKANEIYKEVFILRPNYAQSYYDMANSYRNVKELKRAAALYTRYEYLLKEGFMLPDTVSFSPMMAREFNNLLKLEGSTVVDAKKSKKLYVAEEEFEGMRLVFEWNDSEAEFELQFVNPTDQYYEWKHSLASNRDIIANEKLHGYSSSEYLIDDSLPGTWKVNINYLGNKSLTPTYLKTTIYHNYGSKNQRKEILVHKLRLKNKKQELFSVITNGKVVQ